MKSIRGKSISGLEISTPPYAGFRSLNTALELEYPRDLATSMDVPDPTARSPNVSGLKCSSKSLINRPEQFPRHPALPYFPRAKYSEILFMPFIGFSDTGVRSRLPTSFLPSSYSRITSRPFFRDPGLRYSPLCLPRSKEIVL